MAVPKVETLETPTTKFIKEANPVRVVLDDLGRTIRYKNLTILEQARLARALGEHSSNLMYSRMLAIAAAVISIDGEDGPPRTTINFLEARLAWLKDEGWNAVVIDDATRLETETEDKAQAAKN